MRSLTTHLLAVLTAALLAAAAAAQIPVRGHPVPELSWLDTEMVDFMSEFGISNGLLAVMKDGCIVYQRGFGWHDSGENFGMPENALVRIASCTKPITAAAIRKLIADGHFSLTTNAFDLGQPDGGILPHDPHPALVDTRLRQVTVQHLLEHRGGWDRDPNLGVGDLTHEECTIAGDFGVTPPPGPDLTMRWILGQPLQHTPGAERNYSNVGYLALGLIVEHETGQDFMTYVRQNILTQADWIPSTDLRQGRTFEAWQPRREAWYDGSFGQHCVFNNSECVFGCGTAITNSAYGAWDHEARFSIGGIVLSPATALKVMDRYSVRANEDIGLPLIAPRAGSHGGTQDGVNALFRQRSDGINVFIFFNEDGDGESNEADSEDPANFASTFYNRIGAGLSAQSNWPTLCVDGFWVMPQAIQPPNVYGSYDREFNNVSNALTELGHGSRLNFKPGDYAWTGTISTKLQLRAPLGVARLGSN